MTFERLAELVKRTTYKPTWRVGVDGNFLRVDYRTLDSRSVEGLTELPEVIPEVKIGWSHLIPPHLGDDQPVWGWPNPERSALEWVKGCLREMEEHEADEWFRLDGFRLVDPHQTFRKNRVQALPNGG